MNTATADEPCPIRHLARRLAVGSSTAEPLERTRNAMTLDMVINIPFVLFVGNPGILWRQHRYVFANLARLAFILLRRDGRRPRPIKLASYWPIAFVHRRLHRRAEVVGVGWFQTAGNGAVYGGMKEVSVSRPGLSLLCSCSGGWCRTERPLARGDADDARRQSGRAPRARDAIGVVVRRSACGGAASAAPSAQERNPRVQIPLARRSLKAPA